MTVLMYPGKSVFGLNRSQRPISPSGNVDLSFKSWNGFAVTNPARSRPVLSISTRGEAIVFNPVSRASFRVAQSKPAEGRGSRTPTKTPARVGGIEGPIGPTCPTPPPANWLPTAPTYVHPVRANVLMILFSEPESGVSDSRAA